MTGMGQRFYNLRPLKGKRLTTFCALLALLHPLLSLTHWIFRSLMLHYKSSSHSAKCVRCASLRSGGRRLAVRTAMECHFDALPCTPFCLFEAFPLKGKRGTVTLLASPLGEEGHKVAKGVQANWIHRGAPRPASPVRRHPAKSVWTVVILIMILDVDVTAAGGIIKLIALRAIPQPSGQRPVKLKNPPAHRAGQS